MAPLPVLWEVLRVYGLLPSFLEDDVLSFFRSRLDAIGMCASSLCMVHCLAFPLILALLPVLRVTASQSEVPQEAVVISPAETAQPCSSCCEKGGCSAGDSATAAPVANDACCSTPTDFWIHVGLFAGVAPLGLVAWGGGFHQHHRYGPLVLGVAGVLLLGAAMLAGSYLLGGRGEQLMTVGGSVCMVSAHVWNRRACRCCNDESQCADEQQCEARAGETA